MTSLTHIKYCVFDSESIAALQGYAWPGNVRQLENVVERAVALSQTALIQLTDLPKPIRELTEPSTKSDSPLAEISREQALDDADHAYLTALLEKHDGNISQAARQAGLSRQGMHKLLSRHGLDAAEFRH